MEVTEDGTIFTCTLHHYRLHHLHQKFILLKMVVFSVRALITGDGGILWIDKFSMKFFLIEDGTLLRIIYNRSAYCRWYHSK